MEELKNVNAENVQENSMKDEYKCIKCGTILKDGQEFCPKCGTKKGDINNKKCQNCGEIVEPGEKFCHKCGAKIKLDITSDVLQEAKKFKSNS